MSKKKITSIVKELIVDKVSEMGLLIWNIEFVKEAKDWFLRVYLDKNDQEEGSVSLQECEELSRFLSEKLDEVDAVEPNYYLEVSSPGLERELIEDWHFERNIGKLIHVKLYKALDGKKSYEGTLVGFDSSVLSLQVDENNIDISREQVAKANLVFVF